MMAAAVTLWLTFAVWLAAPHLRLPAGIARTALALLAAELVTLLAWSYGCEGGECTPLAAAAGTVARTDVPILATAFVVLLAARGLRRLSPRSRA